MQSLGSNNKILYYPMIMVVGYLAATIFLYAFGPIEWPLKNGMKLFFLLVSYTIAFAIGYFKGIAKGSAAHDISAEKEKDLYNFTKWSLPIAIIIFVIISIRNYGFNSFDIPGLINRITNGIGNIGAGYSDKVNRMNENLNGSDVFGGTLFTIIVYIWDFFDYNVLLLSIKFFKTGDLLHKVLTATLCFMNVVFYVANGTNIGVFRILLAIFIFYFFEKIEKKNQYEYETRRVLSTKKKIGIAVLAIICVIAFFFYFSKTMKSRGAYDNGASPLLRFSGMQLNQARHWRENIPAGLYFLLLALTSYTTQGYYGMSLALSEKWTPMFGLGNSMAVINVLKQFWPRFAEKSFLYKIEQHYQWSSTVQWSSCYTWIANDASFPGVVIVVYFLGMIMAMSFSDAIKTRNPLASVVFYYMVLICLFLPANNQIGQSFATLFSMILALVWWQRTRRGKSYNRIKFVL